ncbi:hypothetical protein D3C81_682520 [compost metagenome]
MDVGELSVAQGLRVDIDPASGIRQRAFANELGRHLRRHHMQHVEGLDAGFSTAIGQCTHERRTLAGAVHRRQAVGVVEVYSVLVDISHQRRDVVGHAKQHGTGVEEAGFYLP